MQKMRRKFEEPEKMVTMTFQDREKNSKNHGASTTTTAKKTCLLLFV